MGASPEPTHWVDVTDTMDRAVESLRAHATYLEALGEGGMGSDPDAFLRGSARSAGERVGVECAVTFEVIWS
jgi:LmbE family N-acetylglucosaminyl deacetylase